MRVFVVAMAQGFDGDQQAPLENEPAHKLAWSEVVDILSDDDFSGERAVPGKSGNGPARRYGPAGCELYAANRIAKVAYRCGLAANRDNLQFVHPLFRQFAATTERRGWFCQ